MRGATPSQPLLTHKAFQSTPPVRGATHLSPWIFPVDAGFNPRPPCGERPLLENKAVKRTGVSIHAPRAGSDSDEPTKSAVRGCFNPRPPCGERRPLFDATSATFSVSIHAPRAGSDGTKTYPAFSKDVSIHAPRAGSDRRVELFSSGAKVSIHAPRAGSDFLMI
ncbi:Uncharacterized protein dnm_098580 [Desulfonema magnum]|uniref:Uncharacterized protein n=1 Tax=Desulfonema magnum TaxID=45655 RepID=A0A975BZI3_9BACT|nr:Uncharacterized protein dnm_098580 [Desulfonema magnum]